MCDFCESLCTIGRVGKVFTTSSMIHRDCSTDKGALTQLSSGDTKYVIIFKTSALIDTGLYEHVCDLKMKMIFKGLYSLL